MITNKEQFGLPSCCLC